MQKQFWNVFPRVDIEKGGTCFMHLIRFATAVIILSGIVSSAEWTVEVQRKEKADYLYGKQVYPEYLLNPGRAADWARIGSAGGHRLRVTEVDAPGRPGRKALMFSVKIDRKNPRAPGWVAWQAALSPELNIVGADEIEFEIYPLQKIPFGVVARFGTSKGFGQLPCSWSDIVKGLEPDRWHTVRIPIKKSRRSVDSLRFDFNARGDAVPHQREFSMIIGAIRFLPAPHPATAVWSTRMITKDPLDNGFLMNPNPLEMADDADLQFNLELAVRHAVEAVLELRCGKKILMKKIQLEVPCSELRIRIPRFVQLLPPGKYGMEIILRKPTGEIIARGAEAMPLALFSSTAMKRERDRLLTRLNALSRQRNGLRQAGIFTRLPDVTLTTAELFLKHFIPDDFNRQKKYSVALSELAEVACLLDDVTEELAAYCAGKFREPPLPVYDPALPLVVQNGVITQRGQPLLFIGPLTGMPALNWSEYAAKLGFNSLVVETDMDRWLNFDAARDQELKTLPDLIFGPPRLFRGEAERLTWYLERCRANGLAANLLLSSHYCKHIPGDLRNARSAFAGHNNFDWNVLAPEAKKAFRRMYRNLMPFLRGNPHLVSLGTANEPGYSVKSAAGEFEQDFIHHLSEKYVSVEALNRAWGTRYVAVNHVRLREVFSPQAPLQARVDWAEYLSHTVSLFYGFLKEELLQKFPDRQIWVKLMGNFGYEMLDEADNIAVGQNVAGSDSANEPWLDHLRSLFPELPVTNHEWHFIRAEYTSCAPFLAMRMFQGVSRGVQSGNIWRGQRAEWESRGYGHAESFSRYPTALNAIGRTSLKLRMLYPTLVRFQQLDGGAVRLYYDKNDHLLQGKTYLSELLAVYDRLRINPDGVRFLYPQKLTPELLNGIKLIAAGSIRHIPPQIAERLAEWVAAGGTLWLRRPGPWTDYRGVPVELPAEFSNALKSTGTFRYGRGQVITLPDWREHVAFMPGPVAWCNGAPSDVVECRRLISPGGRMEYLSIVNLKGNTQHLRLQNGQVPVRISGKDLWNNTEYSPSQEITLGPFEIRLIEITMPSAGSPLKPL